MSTQDWYHRHLLRGLKYFHGSRARGLTPGFMPPSLRDSLTPPALRGRGEFRVSLNNERSNGDHSRKLATTLRAIPGKRKDKRRDDIDACQAPMADFINARKAISTRLKESASPGGGPRKALIKPSVSACWESTLLKYHGFDHLLETGQRIRQARQRARCAYRGVAPRGAFATIRVGDRCCSALVITQY